MVDLVVLGLNDIGEQVVDWLHSRDDATIQAVVEEKNELDVVRSLEPTVVVSAGFRHIVPEDILAVPDRGAVNLHKSYLPYNRGANPNVWSIIDDHPAGVSVHYMTGEVDAGPIIDRREVPVYPDDTGRDLYDRLEGAQYEQFTDVWPDIRDGSADTTPQNTNAGTYHYKNEFVDLWELDRTGTVTVGDFIDRLRALTFPPYENAYFEVDGDRYYVEIDITPANETGSSADGTAIGEEGRLPENSEKNIPEYPDDGFE